MIFRPMPVEVNAVCLPRWRKETNCDWDSTTVYLTLAQLERQNTPTVQSARELVHLTPKQLSHRIQNPYLETRLRGGMWSWFRFTALSFVSFLLSCMTRLSLDRDQSKACHTIVVSLGSYLTSAWLSCPLTNLSHGRLVHYYIWLTCAHNYRVTCHLINLPH